MHDVETILLQECCNTKSTRENLINMIFEQYEELSYIIINKYELDRIKDKYVTKHRSFIDNSYSKKKIKEEEIVFIRKAYVFRRVYQQMQENIKIKNLANKITQDVVDDTKYADIDFEVYREIFYQMYEELKKT